MVALHVFHDSERDVGVVVVQKRGGEPLSFHLKGSQPPNSGNFLEIKAYKNHYSSVKSYS